MLANLVKRAGWTALVARDGLEALETLQKEARPPDLIFSDVEMPRMDGYELTSTIRADAALKHVPVVFITSRAGERHRRRGFDVGASGYLVKPFDEQALMALIERLVGARALSRTGPGGLPAGVVADKSGADSSTESASVHRFQGRG